jgi:hypothetical protein
MSTAIVNPRAVIPCGFSNVIPRGLSVVIPRGYWRGIQTLRQIDSPPVAGGNDGGVAGGNDDKGLLVGKLGNC